MSQHRQPLNVFQKKKMRKICLSAGIIVLFLLIMTKPLLLFSLSIYEKYITPYNGCCAYRVIHGGESCSEFFEHNLREKGVISAVIAMPKQFSQCREAYLECQRRIENGDTAPACCVAASCCAELSTTPVPIN